MEVFIYAKGEGLERVALDHLETALVQWNYFSWRQKLDCLVNAFGGRKVIQYSRQWAWVAPGHIIIGPRWDELIEQGYVVVKKQFTYNKP